MKIMVLECNPVEQKIISEMLNNCEVVYETTVNKAINHLGLEHVDFALVDADFSNKVYDWKELTSFLNFLNIDYSIFSSNGKVGIKNGQVIVSITDIPEVVQKETVNEVTN
jgi:c-di-GMP-related signal transduction protein